MILSKVWMIKRIVVLLKILSKMNNLFNIYWDWSNRFLFISSWHLVILITSRDRNHITWFWRNSVSVSLLATLSHRTWVASDFFIISTSSKSDRNSQIALFENFSTNENFFFLLISCTRNRHSTVIVDYIRRDDVIWCELDRLALIEIESRLHFLKFVVQTKKFLFDSFCVCEIDTQRWSKII
jgi:hypothetical protein